MMPVAERLARIYPAPFRLLVGSLVLLLSGTAPAVAAQLPTTGQGLYEVGCAKCHGSNGKGVDPSQVGFDVPLPDFSDCAFASREPDADWLAVTHLGGPARAFDTTMPAYAEAFDDEQIQKIIDYLRTFCTDEDWPRGELNLPLPLVTEKAFPEDEAVWSTAVAVEGNDSAMNEIVYERRLGPRNQIEVKLPFGVLESTDEDSWHGGIGDVAVGVKRALYHRYASGAGSIFSAAGEVRFPTGDEDRGLGTGAVVFEPFVAFGHLLPNDGFLQLQTGLEVPTENTGDTSETFWRAVVGRGFSRGRFGRTFTPMLEVLGVMEWGDRDVQWDLVPQMQVALSTRQHVLFNVGARFPVTDSAERSTQILFYILWDWFDGGFLEGW